jgi:hypothetical protein
VAHPLADVDADRDPRRVGRDAAARDVDRPAQHAATSNSLSVTVSGSLGSVQ